MNTIDAIFMDTDDNPLDSLKQRLMAFNINDSELYPIESDMEKEDYAAVSINPFD
jgi:hypothetical protein